MALADETKGTVTPRDPLAKAAAGLETPPAETAPPAEAPLPKRGFINYLKQHPKGFWFIFWGEFAERCSYYGVRAILARYIADAATDERIGGLGLGQGYGAMYNA